MSSDLETLKPVEGANRPPRRHLGLKDEFILALLPTLMILLVLAAVEALGRQRLLFASLASSAFLIYMDPYHGTNNVRTIVIAHLTAALGGLATFEMIGPGYTAGGAAMAMTIVAMISLDAVHPPAAATALIFAFRDAEERNLILFVLALSVIALLVILQRAMLWIFSHVVRRQH